MTQDNEAIARVAIVTGSSQGIGAACVRALAEDGFNVAVNYRSDSSKEAAEALAARMQDSFSVKACAIQADVSDFEQAKGLCEQAKEQFGRIDVLVNNAGMTRDGLLMRMSEEQFDSVVSTNLGGTFNCMRNVVSTMVKQRYGRIINISSVVGIFGNAGQTNYSASKAGIIGLTKSAAKELGSRSITVNAVAPGFIKTAMTEGLDEKASGALTDRISLSRLGEAEDVANAVAFLASDRAAYITGQVLGVDGGISL